jgi:hypothetical protein
MDSTTTTPMRMEESSSNSSSTNGAILYDASPDPAATAAEPMMMKEKNKTDAAHGQSTRRTQRNKCPQEETDEHCKVVCGNNINQYRSVEENYC